MKVGRKTKLSRAKIEEFCALIRSGCFMSVAAGATGIHRNTVSGWLKRGEDLSKVEGLSSNSREDQLFILFYEEATKALAVAEAADVQRIDIAAEADWRAAAWKLERRFGRRWNRPPKTEHSHHVTGVADGPIAFTIQNVMDEIDRRAQSKADSGTSEQGA